MDLGRLALRGILGPLFVGHGTQKLFGWFGGHGPEGTGGAFESMGLRPGRRHAIAAGAAETAGGALLTLGAATPVASTLISGVMMTAIRKAHIANGPWVSNGGYEYCLVVIGAATALAESGPGRPSVDASAFPRLRGTSLALLGLAAAGAGSYLATSERFNEPVPGVAPAEGASPLPSDPATADEPRFTRDPAAIDLPTPGATA
jgi:putative oxidoreductase